MKNIFCALFLMALSRALAFIPARPPLQHTRLMSSFETKLKATSRSADAAGNMFYDYDKPLVVIGSSGSSSELERIATAFLSDHFAINSSTDGEGILHISNIEDEGQLSLAGQGILNSIATGELRWPNTIVIDFNDEAISRSDGKQAQELENHYIDMAKSLYTEHGILSIYVNVHSEDGEMEKTARERKTRIENDVLVKYSDYELCIRDEGLSKADDERWEHINWEFARLVARARLIPPIPGDTKRSDNTAHLTMGQHTFFLSLTFPEISQVEPYVEEMCQDVDAMEYRTDLLNCRDSRFDLIYGMQILRSYCRPHVVRVPALNFGRTVLEDVMPIVYTVRTQNQAGTYPDDPEAISKMFEMLEWGLRAGSEVLDIESAWERSKTENLLSLAEQRYSSQILGSHHVVGIEVTTEQAVELFQQCALNGRAHGAKVVLSIESESKDRIAYEAASIASALAAQKQKPVIPNISLILGDVGKFSRVLNFPFTPVTHESLPFKAAPGQMTASEIMTTRVLTNILEKKVFAILGHNIAYSVSPQMHGGAFGATRLPHKYVRADVATVEEFVEGGFFQGDSFGGASVTIPHKQSIIPYIDVLSEAVKAIGSCNTLIAKDEVDPDNAVMKRVIYGDNTDWKGIFNPLNRLLGGQTLSDSDFALILGAGGTARAAAYVAEKLGLKRIYYNRTHEKAQDLVDSFGGVVVSNLDEEGDEKKSLGEILKQQKGSIRVVISTLPAAAEFTMPEWLLQSQGKKPIVFDVNYKPYNTKLLLQAEKAGCDLVRGSEMLWEQGIGQFELWTGRTAPYSVMKNVVLRNCITSEDQPSLSELK